MNLIRLLITLVLLVISEPSMALFMDSEFHIYLDTAKQSDESGC